MARYDRSYDFGMRGYRQATRPLRMQRGRGYHYDRSFELSYPGAEPGYPAMPRHVTARYNRDYVDAPRGYDRGYGRGYGFRGGSRYDRDGYGFRGGDRPDRIGDETFYRRPYSTIGGTRTLRGATGPRGYAPGRYGPTYGGRFPDEL